jgi:cell division protein FtsL
MHPFIWFILFIAVVITVAKVFNRYLAKKDAREAQKRIDANIEWQLLDGLCNLTVKTLATHSDNKKIASIVSARICDYLEMAVHPYQLATLFENLGLFISAKNDVSDKEIELSALIQHYVLTNIDSYNMDVWNKQVCDDKKIGYAKLNKSFLARVKKDMLVWSPFDN